MITPVTPPTGYPTGTWLTDLATAKDELGVTDGASDGRIGRLIGQASAMCGRYCGRPFHRARWLETLAGACWPMVLARLPVVAIVSVTGGGQVLDVGTYEVDQEAGLLSWVGAGWGGRVWCAPQFAVTYDAGYVVPGDGTDAHPRTLAEDVERACLEVVKALWFSGGPAARDPALRSESVEGIGATSWLDPQSASGGLPVLAATLLAPYRMARV